MYYCCTMTLINHLIIISNSDITVKSREQGLITKEHIATHTIIFNTLLPPSYSSIIFHYTFYRRKTSSVTLTTKLSRLLNAQIRTKATPTFIAEAFRLCTQIQLLKPFLYPYEHLIQPYLTSLRLVFTTRFVTKATPAFITEALHLSSKEQRLKLLL